jgi:hypothetical protein
MSWDFSQPCGGNRRRYRTAALPAATAVSRAAVGRCVGCYLLLRGFVLPAVLAVLARFVVVRLVVPAELVVPADLVVVADLVVLARLAVLVDLVPADLAAPPALAVLAFVALAGLAVLAALVAPVVDLVVARGERGLRALVGTAVASSKPAPVTGSRVMLLSAVAISAAVASRSAVTVPRAAGSGCASRRTPGNASTA